MSTHKTKKLLSGISSILFDCKEPCQGKLVDETMLSAKNNTGYDHDHNRDSNNLHENVSVIDCIAKRSFLFIYSFIHLFIYSFSYPRYLSLCWMDRIIM